jgi:hypothetical protein
MAPTKRIAATEREHRRRGSIPASPGVRLVMTRCARALQRPSRGGPATWVSQNRPRWGRRIPLTTQRFQMWRRTGRRAERHEGDCSIGSPSRSGQRPSDCLRSRQIRAHWRRPGDFHRRVERCIMTSGWSVVYCGCAWCSRRVSSGSNIARPPGSPLVEGRIEKGGSDTAGTLRKGC